MRKISNIILHHSLTKDSKTVSIGVIRNYHKKVMGWDDIGYHYLIEKLRDQTEIVIGRMCDVTGAHCRGYNQDTIGICFVGNFDLKEPSRESWEQGIKLVKFLQKQYNIEARDVIGHTELNLDKSCPGKMFDLDKFRKEIL